MCSKLTIKTPEQRQCLYCQLWTYFTPCPTVSIVKFEHVIANQKSRWNFGETSVYYFNFYRDVDGVLTSANDTEYGIASGVFTKDLSKMNSSLMFVL